MPVVGCGENVREIPWRVVEANHGERGLVSLGKGACAMASAPFRVCVCWPAQGSDRTR